MNLCSWIVCERGGRWVPALRMAIARDREENSPRHRLREVRHLAELATELADRPASIVAVDVHRGNFADALTWLADAQHVFPSARSIALCDRSIHSLEIEAALREAGAAEVVASPRQLKHLLHFARRHAESVAEHAATMIESDSISLTARAWASLPWQDA
jgi:hypothetical protein